MFILDKEILNNNQFIQLHGSYEKQRNPIAAHFMFHR